MRADFITQVYKSDVLARAIVRRVFISTDLFRDSPLIQSILKEAADEAAEKASREARVQNTRELAQTTLEGRFQMLDADLLQAIGTANEATLRTIFAHVSSDTLEQVSARLGPGPQG